MTIKGAEFALIVTAFMLSAVCILYCAPEMAAEDDEPPTIFVIDDRDWKSPDMHPEMNDTERLIRMIGGFELVSERMVDHGPGSDVYVDYPGIVDMAPHEKDLVMNLTNIIGVKSVLDGMPDEYRTVTIDVPNDFNEIGTHDFDFINEVIDCLEDSPEFQEVADELEKISAFNRIHMEILGREIACADTKAAGEETDEEDDDGFSIEDAEQEPTVPEFDAPAETQSITLFAAHIGINETFSNLEL